MKYRAKFEKLLPGMGTLGGQPRFQVSNVTDSNGRLVAQSLCFYQLSFYNSVLYYCQLGTQLEIETQTITNPDPNIALTPSGMQIVH